MRTRRPSAPIASAPAVDVAAGGGGGRRLRADRAFDRGQQIGGVDRLGEIRRDAQLGAARLVAVFAGRAQHHDRGAAPASGRFAISAATSKPSMSGMFASSRTSSNGRSVARRRASAPRWRRVRSSTDGRRHPPALDLLGENAPVDVVVVDDQHVEMRRRGIGRRGLGRVGDVEGDGEMERAAGARLALDPDAVRPSTARAWPRSSGRGRCRRTGASSIRPPGGRPRRWRRVSPAGCRCPVSVTLKCSFVLPAGARLFSDGDEDVAALGELERVADQVGQDLLNAASGRRRRRPARPGRCRKSARALSGARAGRAA